MQLGRFILNWLYNLFSSSNHFILIIFAGLYAVVAQLVEHQLPKLRVVGSSPIYRSSQFLPKFPPDTSESDSNSAFQGFLFSSAFS